MIHPSTIEEIKNRLDIVDVIGDYVSLKKAGSSYRALSPFTSEKTPSFYVVPSKGIFKDFSSGKGGDAINFIMEIDGLNYIETLRYLANKYGINIREEEQTDEDIEIQNKRDSLFIILDFAKQYFQKQLHHSQEGKSIAKSYLKERQLSDKTIESFELGFSQNSWDHFLKDAISKGYNVDLLQEAGLIIQKEDEKRSYDRFRNRIMFPIHNPSGKTIAFGGRQISEVDKSAKYINSPETILYIKSNVLYGLFQAKNEIKKSDNCLLVEGYTDVISMHQIDIKNVVSTSGTALTTNQIKLIRRYTENVTMIFDADPSGIRASLRSIDLFLEEDINIRIVKLPENEDPDSFAKKKGGEEFQSFITKESQDAIKFKIKILLDENNDDLTKKSKVIGEVLYSIAKIKDPVKRSLYIKEYSQMLGIPEAALISEHNKIQITNNKKQAPPLPRTKDDTSDTDEYFPEIHKSTAQVIELQERESIRLLLNYGNQKIAELDDIYLIQYLLRELEKIEFIQPTYKKIIDIFKENLQKGIIIDSNYLLDAPDEEIKKSVVDLVIEKHEVSPNWKEKHDRYIPHEKEHLRDATYKNVLRLKSKIIQKMIEKKNETLKIRYEDAERDELLDEIIHLQNISKQITSELKEVVPYSPM